MTIPLERSLAVLWAGGLLVQLNGDARVPMDIRRMATRIARNFPTVGDVANASHLSLLGRDGGMFEHPRDCKGWEEKCPGRPLIYSTRLHRPSEEADNAVNEDADADIDYENGPLDSEAEAMDHLDELIDAVARARDALHRGEERVLAVCVALRPELTDCFARLGWSQRAAAEWVNTTTFEESAKSAAQRFAENRENDVLDRLDQLRCKQANRRIPKS